MLLTHFDYDEYIAYQRADAAEDAREEARIALEEVRREARIAVEEARKEAVEDGIIKLVEATREVGISEEQILRILEQKYNLNHDAAMQYLN